MMETPQEFSSAPLARFPNLAYYQTHVILNLRRH